MAKKQSVFSGLYNLFSTDFDELFSSMTENEIQTVEDSTEIEADNVTEETDNNYLSWGVRLMTMAKESMPIHREYSALQEKIFSQSYENLTSMGELLHIIATKVIRPVLRQSSGNQSEDMLLLKALTPHFDWNIYTFEELKSEKWFEFIPGRFEHTGFSLRDVFSNKKTKFKPGEEILYMTCAAKGEDPAFLIIGSRMEPHADGHQNCYYTSFPWIKCCDLAYAVAFLFVLDSLQTNLLSEDFFNCVAFRNIRNRAAMVYRNCRHTSLRDADSYCSVPMTTLEGRNIILSNAETNWNPMVPIVIKVLKDRGCYVMSFLDDIIPYLKELYPMERVTLALLKKNPKQLKELGEKIIHSYPTTDNTPLILSYEQCFYYLIAHADRLTQEEVSWLLSYNALLATRKGTNGQEYKYGLCKRHWVSFNDPLHFVIDAFCAYTKLAKREVQIIKAERASAESYAKSFETKKNIPAKILDKMENSILNERFGYVEYDEQCDMNAIDVVSQQVLSFVEQFFSKQDISKVSLRFRRLGNHRASGLYYPFFKCICVDIKSPGSFVHEFGHMLDYTSGMLSNTLQSSAFAALYRAYERFLRNKAAGDDCVKAQLEGNTKYNMDYFLKETEVFARCFELYFAHFVGLDNTLIDGMERFKGFAYPDTPEFLLLVKTYFEQLPCMEDVKQYAVRELDLEEKESEVS